MREAILRITMPDNWVGEVSKKYSPDIKFIECMPYGESGGRGLIEIGGAEDMIQLIVSEIRNHHDVQSVETSPLHNGKVLASIITNKCSACRALADSDCYLLWAFCLGDGRVEWKLITSGEGSLSQLIENLENGGCKVDFVESGQLSKKKLLTGRQEEIVRLALEKGYYDYPKRITIKDLAKLFHVSPSTIYEIVQRGEKKIIREHFHSRI